jgi:hypothetical protein
MSTDGFKHFLLSKIEYCINVAARFYENTVQIPIVSSSKPLRRDFEHENTYKQSHQPLKELPKAAFIKGTVRLLLFFCISWEVCKF